MKAVRLASHCLKNIDFNNLLGSRDLPFFFCFFCICYFAKLYVCSWASLKDALYERKDNKMNCSFNSSRTGTNIVVVEYRTMHAKLAFIM